MILTNEALTLARTALGNDSVTAEDGFRILLAAVEAGGEQAVLALARAEAAEADLEAANADVLRLSRSDAPDPDPVMLSLFSRSLKTQREQAIVSGGVTEACAKAIDSLFLPGGKPTALALSRAGDSNPDPVISRLYDVLATNGGGLRHNTPAERSFVASRQIPTGTAADAADGQESISEIHDEAGAEVAEWQNRMLAARGLTPAK